MGTPGHTQLAGPLREGSGIPAKSCVPEAADSSPRKLPLTHPQVGKETEDASSPGTSQRAVGEDMKRPEPSCPGWDLNSTCCEALGKCLKRVKGRQLRIFHFLFFWCQAPGAAVRGHRKRARGGLRSPSGSWDWQAYGWEAPSNCWHQSKEEGLGWVWRGQWRVGSVTSPNSCWKSLGLTHPRLRRI